MTYLQSAAKFGFPLRKILPDQLWEKCLNQEWSSIEIKSGLKEGQGVFANKCIKKMSHCAIMVEFMYPVIMQRNIFFQMKTSVIT